MGRLDVGGSREAHADSSANPGGSVRLGTYLRKLREGYGYTLRKVEERATALGEAIDNSQLSRFEKGKAVPSFDKLRALARVFNVPVQNFSDVLDLEQFQHLKPQGTNWAELLESGQALLRSGEHGRAFVTFERALEVAEAVALDGGIADAAEMIAESRWRMACALKRLGKLYMTEVELRQILKDRVQLGVKSRLRTLLQLSYLYQELGDLYLATVLGKECLELARRENDLETQAGVLNSLGNSEFEEGRSDRAAEYYGQSLAVLEEISGHLEMKTIVRTNLGGCLGSLERTEEALAMLDQAQQSARRHGFRRSAALALTRTAEVLLAGDRRDEAKLRLAESDALASQGDEAYQDILFLNAFHRWSIARSEGNGTGEKIAFGRLRHLRPTLQRRFREVDEFDQHVERTRRS
jgi:transcriptional regulator with XRE-family HTH domain